jgi:hypothetical protein
LLLTNRQQQTRRNAAGWRNRQRGASVGIYMESHRRTIMSARFAANRVRCYTINLLYPLASPTVPRPASCWRHAPAWRSRQPCSGDGYDRGIRSDLVCTIAGRLPSSSERAASRRAASPPRHADPRRARRQHWGLAGLHARLREVVRGRVAPPPQAPSVRSGISGSPVRRGRGDGCRMEMGAPPVSRPPSRGRG